MAHRVNYRRLANYLQALPIVATNADLATALDSFLAYDLDYQQRIGTLIRVLPQANDWLEGLSCLCDFLKSENPRFIAELFVGWAMEDK